jgi:hypothetical protein
LLGFSLSIPRIICCNQKNKNSTHAGNWSRGRPVSLKRLRKTGEIDYLTPQDLKICAHIFVESSYYGQNEYHFERRAIIELIGHPLVFWEDSPGTR